MGRWNPEKWQEYQEVYTRLQKQDGNRLNVSSWLGGLTLAAFSALAVGSSFQSTLPDLGHSIPFLVATLLAMATLTFLVTAYSAYQSIRLVARLSGTNVSNLEDSHDQGANALDDHSAKVLDEKAAKVLDCLKLPRRDANEKSALSDSERLRKAWRIHEEADSSITVGLVLLCGALIGIALEINVWIAVVAVACLIVLLLHSRSLIGLLRVKKDERV